MRVGIISDTYPPEVNGVALTVQRLAAGLAALGHAVELILPQHEPPHCHEADIAILSAAVTARPRYTSLRLGLPAGRLLRHHWKQHRPDVIYIATKGLLGWSALRCAKHMRIPVITGFHTRFDRYASHYGVSLFEPMVRRYLRHFHRFAHITLVPTRALAVELARQGVSDTYLLRRAVDTQRFHPQRRDPELRARWQADGSTPVVLYVGRIAAEKNLQLAVRAFRVLQKHVPLARYVWVGDGPERAALQSAHPDFIFAGIQRDAELARHYASADLFPFTSLSETLDNVILEALASGLPVVAFDESAAREYLSSAINGYCIQRGDDDAFIQATCTLAGNAGLIRHMGRAARESVMHLSPNQMIREFEQLLHRLIGENPHARHATMAHA